MPPALLNLSLRWSCLLIVYFSGFCFPTSLAFTLDIRHIFATYILDLALKVAVLLASLLWVKTLFMLFATVMVGFALRSS